MTYVEKELYASNAKLGWFKYKLSEIECQLGEANLCALSLEERVCNLGADIEL